VRQVVISGAIEGSVSSQLTTLRTTSDVLAWYVTLDSFGSAIGTEGSGRVVEWLKGLEGWIDVYAYHTVLGADVVIGLANAILVLLMVGRIETEKVEESIEGSEMLLGRVEGERPAPEGGVGDEEVEGDRHTEALLLSEGTT